MNNVREYLFLGIFGVLVLHNTLVILNILFSPKWMEGKKWLSFPSGPEKLPKILYCLSAIMLFIISINWKLEKLNLI